MYKINKKLVSLLSWKIVLGLIIFIIFFVFSKFAGIIIIKLNQWKNKDKKVDSSKGLLFNFIVKSIVFVCIVIGAFISLSFMGVNLSTILVILGSAGLGIAFALKDFLSSCVNGMVIISLDYFKIGDLIKVGETLGNVTNFDLLTTSVTDIEDIVHIIPNNKIVGDEFLNYSKNETVFVGASACISNSNVNVDIQRIFKEIKVEMKKSKYIHPKGKVWVYIDKMTDNGTVIGGGFDCDPEKFFDAQRSWEIDFRMFLKKKKIRLCTSGSRYVDQENE